MSEIYNDGLSIDLVSETFQNKKNENNEKIKEANLFYRRDQDEMFK